MFHAKHYSWDNKVKKQQLSAKYAFSCNTKYNTDRIHYMRKSEIQKIIAGIKQNDLLANLFPVSSFNHGSRGFLDALSYRVQVQACIYLSG
jgi:hypothetical protein